MKTLVVFSLIGLLSATAFGAGSEAIIKQRAKELSNQNNVRQGVAPPTQPPPGTHPPTTAAPAPTAQLTPAGRLQLDLAGIKVNSQVTPAQKQQISQDLMAVANSGKKPSSASADKLAASLASALAEKALPPEDRSRLVEDLKAVLNGASLPAAQMQAICDDVQAIFQKNGMKRDQAVGVANDLKVIVSEIQKPAPIK